ncbi:zinc finger, zz type domain-containing protein [Cardiosporidium cionae]|uniref:Zinc finger, zz type domain-containing protein n=1 Tax=Cardiosporidium cionae TaxID=476202 RepID=A0ABQ7JD30_9APIC|nr:zinc finger, zz type domain-containing protein [Cardiosporidium cionae]|eukprot:KAF8821900.1 zinc finger, zz type domain-containing protein [Cardiosporidium cionae]
MDLLCSDSEAELTPALTPKLSEKYHPSSSNKSNLHVTIPSSKAKNGQTIAQQRTSKADLTVNKKYAKEFEERKQVEDLQNNKHILNEAMDSSSSEEEDDDARLLTRTVEKKIFETLNKIKKKDPEIYSSNHTIFEDEDFDIAQTETQGETVKEEKQTYKDVVREALLSNGADAFVKEESKMRSPLPTTATYREEQESARKAFLHAAETFLQENENESFLSKKQKTETELAFEDAEQKQFLKKHHLGDTEEVMRHYWAADEDLDEKEQFLRDYVLNEGWKNPTAFDGEDDPPVNDDEDEEHLEKVDQFESAYNFRFEESEGTQIRGYSRMTPGSVRRKDESRKHQREEKKRHQEEFKIQKREELKRLKNLKKKELLDKLRKIQEISGRADLSADALDLESPFDETKHEQLMQNICGDDYYCKEEPLSHAQLFSVPPLLEKEFDISDVKNEEVLTITKKQKKLAKFLKKRKIHVDDGEAYIPIPEGESQVNTIEYMENDIEAVTDENYMEGMENEIPEEDDTDHLWWMCDCCNLGIPGGKNRYECSICENFALCKKCHTSTRHHHPLIRKRIPDESQPPAEFLETSAKDSLVEQFLEEYKQLDYEDIIGKDLPTRFKYEKVAPNSFGLTTEDILTRNDAELNAYLSLKKIAPYRETQASSRRRSKANSWLQKKSKAAKSIEQTRKASTSAINTDHRKRLEKKPQQKHKFVNVNGKSSVTKSGLSADRLKSYGIVEKSPI